MNTSDLRRQADDPNWIVRRSVAENLDTPADVLAALARDVDKDVRQAAARNPNISADTLRDLARDVNAEVRRLAERNASARGASEPLSFADARPEASRSLAADLWRKARDRNWIVRRGVAERPDVPADLLAELARDADKDVRCAVACNPKASPKLLGRLALDVDAEVRRKVARNPNVSAEILKTLAQNTDKLVRLTAVGLLALRPCSAEERAWLRTVAFGVAYAAPHPDEGEKHLDEAKRNRSMPSAKPPKSRQPASTPPRLPDQAREVVPDVPDASDVPDTASKKQIVGKAIGRELTRGAIQRLGAKVIEGLFELLSE
jgi:hypothetical protein